MNQPPTIKVALAGCGTVGSGVGEIIINRGDALAERTGLRFQVTRALVSDLRRKRSAPFDAGIYTDDPQALLAADYDMLVEVIGGTDTARTVVLGALSAGKPVVTANKALLALHGAEIYRAARENGTCIAFEASCAGGLPIIGALLRGLQANRIDTVIGIFNSTCNFVLTAMLDGGKSLADAVAEAQKCGYAEADPTLDISGGDTAHKLTIVASLAFGRNVDFSRIAMQGIDRLALEDLVLAREMGYACKLLGVARRVCTEGDADGERLDLSVRPTLIPAAHPLACLTGTSSGMVVRGDVVGETFYSGAGAGSLPTASAVVADMIEVATGAAQATFSALRIYNDRTPTVQVRDPGDSVDPYYVRLNVDPAQSDSLPEIERAFAAAPIALQRGQLARDRSAAAVITQPVARKRLTAALRMLAGQLPLSGEPVVLPVLAE